MPTIFVSEYDAETYELLECALRACGAPVRFLDHTEDLFRIPAHWSQHDIFILDLDAAGEKASGLLDRVAHLHPALRVITLSSSSQAGANAAASRTSNGRAFLKPICAQVLGETIEAMLASNGETSAAEAGNQLVPDPHSNPQNDISPSGTWSQRIESMLKRIGSSNVPVLLQGETGVGKEVIARKLHGYSSRATGPFVKLNCAALPSELVESELFGYERGAFTGAFKSTPGKFEMAHKGTILLDEIGDMDAKLQAKLLQVLQDQEFFRLGSKESSRVDVRVMAASHCDFEKAMHEKRFREDLYYRLNIIDVKIPPLRERRSEILPLCEYFLDKYATPEWPRIEITPILRQVLVEYSWPGNVRELENAMRKYLVLRSPNILAAEIRQRTVRTKTVYVPAQNGPLPGSADASGELGPSRRAQETARWNFEAGTSLARLDTDRQAHPRPVAVPREESESVTLGRCIPISRQATESALSQVDQARRAAESKAILDALNSSLWNRKRAAMLLNVDYKALLYKMKKLGIGEKKSAAMG